MGPFDAAYRYDSIPTNRRRQATFGGASDAAETSVQASGLVVRRQDVLAAWRGSGAFGSADSRTSDEPVF